MGLVPLENIPMFVTAVFCITGTFIWSNLVLNTKKFVICLIDKEAKAKVRKQWILIVILFIHSLGSIASTFPNCLCTIFSQACPTYYFHYFGCSGYTIAEAMSQGVLGMRLYLFQMNKRKKRWLPWILGTLVLARTIAGAYQCSHFVAFVHVPVWGYWIPIQSTNVLSAVFGMDFINNIVFTGLFTQELYSHYKAVEKHTTQTILYKMRHVLQSAALGGVLAGIGTVILAATVLSGAAVDEEQIVVIFAEQAWNSCIITSMINGEQQEEHHSTSQPPETPHHGAEMSLLTTASVFGARLEAPEPVSDRKSPQQLRSFNYDHGKMNAPVEKDLLSGVQRMEEDYRANISSSELPGISASSLPTLSASSEATTEKGSPIVCESPRNTPQEKEQDI